MTETKLTRWAKENAKVAELPRAIITPSSIFSSQEVSFLRNPAGTTWEVILSHRARSHKSFTPPPPLLALGVSGANYFCARGKWSTESAQLPPSSKRWPEIAQFSWRGADLAIFFDLCVRSADVMTKGANREGELLRGRGANVMVGKWLLEDIGDEKALGRLRPLWIYFLSEHGKRAHTFAAFPSLLKNVTIYFSKWNEKGFDFCQHHITKKALCFYFTFILNCEQVCIFLKKRNALRINFKNGFPFKTDFNIFLLKWIY